MENAFAPISEACVKALSDKTYEKRRVAASEIEKYVPHLRTYRLLNKGFIYPSRMVADFNSKKNIAQIRRIIEVLSRDFVTSNDSNKKKVCSGFILP